MLHFLGRLHLIFLHLPIGFLLLAGALGGWSYWKKTTAHQPALHISVLLGAAMATITAGFGWLLAQDGGYETVLLERHQWLGFTTAGLSWVTWLSRKSNLFSLSLTLTVIVVTLTGHFGGALTHGADYLTRPLMASVPRGELGIASINSNTSAYEAYIQPILKEKCVNCHNATKKKGQLVLDTPDGVKKGGKHGPSIVAGNPDSSLMLQRINLSIHQEEHMPPKGRQQLTFEEIAIIKDWILGGADFTQLASAFRPDHSGAATAIFPPVQVPVISQEVIQNLRAARIMVSPLSHDLPWLSVSVTGKKDLTIEKLTALKQIGPQISYFDAAHSNLDDQTAAIFTQMPNLTRLNLSHTALTSTGLQSLSGLMYLNYVNITHTNIGDEAIEILSKIPRLRALYAWNTKMGDIALKSLQYRLPQLKIETGAIPDTSSALLQLKMPKIMHGRTIFDDTVQVTLDYPLKNVALHYTLDQASPTTESARYRGEVLILDNTTTLRTKAVWAGWADSPVAEAVFFKRKYQPVSATLSTPPNPKYAGDGANSLYDGKLGSSSADKNFLGYQGEHLTVVYDFGHLADFTKIGIHYAQNHDAHIFAPKGIRAWISNDGKNWKESIHNRYATPIARASEKVAFLLETIKNPAPARFLKITVENEMKNPAWHPSKGQKSWVFVDEILVE